MEACHEALSEIMAELDIKDERLRQMKARQRLHSRAMGRQ